MCREKTCYSFLFSLLLNEQRHFVEVKMYEFTNLPEQIKIFQILLINLRMYLNSGKFTKLFSFRRKFTKRNRVKRARYSFPERFTRVWISFQLLPKAVRRGRNTQREKLPLLNDGSLHVIDTIVCCQWQQRVTRQNIPFMSRSHDHSPIKKLDKLVFIVYLTLDYYTTSWEKYITI